jgi:hypothetical protein
MPLGRSKLLGWSESTAGGAAREQAKGSLDGATSRVPTVAESGKTLTVPPLEKAGLWYPLTTTVHHDAQADARMPPDDTAPIRSLFHFGDTISFPSGFFKIQRLLHETD